MSDPQPTSLLPPAQTEEIEKQRFRLYLRRRRLGMRLSVYLHAGIFILANVLWWVFTPSAQHNWHHYPLMGWNMGVWLHIALVYSTFHGDGK